MKRQRGLRETDQPTEQPRASTSAEDERAGARGSEKKGAAIDRREFESQKVVSRGG